MPDNASPDSAQVAGEGRSLQIEPAAGNGNAAANVNKTDQSRTDYPAFEGEGTSRGLTALVEKNVGRVVRLNLNVNTGSIREYRSNFDMAFVEGAKSADGLRYIYFIDCNGTGANWDGVSPERCAGVRWDAVENKVAATDSAVEAGRLSGYFKITRIWTADNQQTRNVMLLPVVISGSSAVQSAQPDEYFKHMRFAHAAALKRYLAGKPGVRPAQISDYDGVKNNPLTGDAGGKDYHPYYAEGDFNSDGKSEYAVVLIDGAGRRSLAVFNAPPNDGNPPRPLFTTAPLADYDTLNFNQEFKVLTIAPVQSDNGYYLKPSGKTYKLESIL